ncbi:MAG: prepilin-type N-terminal cleavage/methylation domain-containing protein [Desulfobacterales bacterium]
MEATSKQTFSRSNQGFTMVELLVAMVVAFLALEAIYSTFLNQHRSYQIQEETAEMQQNLRAALLYMKREIRMAGCDPIGTADARIVKAERILIRFAEDVRGNSPDSDPDGDADDPNEDVTYSLKGKNLVKNTGHGDYVVAQNIDAIDFVYLDGSSPPHVLNDPLIGGDVPAAKINQIRSVEVTIVARTSHPLLPSKNSRVYINQRGTKILPPQNDHVARRRLTTWIKCRNLGI